MKHKATALALVAVLLGIILMPALPAQAQNSNANSAVTASLLGRFT